MDSSNTEVALAAIALAGTICAGFFALVNKQNKTHDKISKSVDKLAESNERMVKSNEAIADATIKGADEAEARNGHLAELVVESRKQILDKVKEK